MRTVIFLLLVGLLSACSKEKPVNEFKTIEYQTDKENENPKITFSFKAKMDLPENTKNDIKEILRDNIITSALGSPYVRQSDSKLLKVYADSSFTEYVNMFADLQLDEAENKAMEAIECATDVTGKAAYMTDDLLAYQCFFYTYSGGAHGMSSILNYIFDLNSGKLLKEKDIFIPEYHRLVHNLLVKNAEPLRNDSILPVEIDPYFNNSLIQPNGNVSVNDSAIVYTFNPYEIAPYCFGCIDINIPKEQILPLLDTTTVVYHHLNK